MATLQGKQDWVSINLIRVMGTAVTVGGLLVLLCMHHVTVFNVTWLYVTISLFGLVLPLGAIAAHGWLGVHPEPSLVRPIMTFGLKAHVGNMAGQANLNLDKMAIATFLAPSDLGLYSVAVTLSAPLTLIGSSIGIVALPGVAASASPKEMRQHFAWLLRSTLVLSAATTVGLVLLTPMLIRLFFGATFLPGVVIAQVTISAALARGAGYVLAYGLCAFDKPLVPSLAELVAVVTTVAGLAVLLPSMGLVGAAITSLLAYTTSTAFMLWFCRRRLGIRLVDLLVPRASDVSQWVSCLRR
jgi:O-antigen/teichoic acid export membrane protein